MRNKRRKYEQNAGHLARSQKRKQKLVVNSKDVSGKFNCFITTVAILVGWVPLVRFFALVLACILKKGSLFSTRINCKMLS